MKKIFVWMRKKKLRKIKILIQRYFYLLKLKFVFPNKVVHDIINKNDETLK